MIELRDFDVYATEEGIFIVGDSDTATRVATPSTAHGLSQELREAWRDVSDSAGSLSRPEPKKSSTGRTKRSTGSKDYDLRSSSEKTTTGSKSSKDYDPTAKQCRECQSTNVQINEGCLTCSECGWSKC